MFILINLVVYFYDIYPLLSNCSEIAITVQILKFMKIYKYQKRSRA